MSYICGMPDRRSLGAAIGATLLCVFLSAAAPDAARYETVLGPTPVNNVTKGLLTGQGAATAALNGNRLSVTGDFSGLASSAIDAHLMMGSGIGIAGEPILALTVSPAASGTLTGTFTLSAEQLVALRNGRLYIQVNTQNAPAPGGNLWGWLLPEHPKAGQDEPQMGHWFLPQGDGLKTPSRGPQF
jgi:CHRD domain